jgi:hypothetical protein
MIVEFDWLGRICELPKTIKRAMRAEIPGVDEVVAKNEGGMKGRVYGERQPIRLGRR